MRNYQICFTKFIIYNECSTHVLHVEHGKCIKHVLNEKHSIGICYSCREYVECVTLVYVKHGECITQLLHGKCVLHMYYLWNVYRLEQNGN